MTGSPLPPRAALRGLRRLGRGRGRRRGAALLLTMWVLLILGLMVASFSFDMRVEAQVTSHYRKRTRAMYLARAGVVWAQRAIELRNEADPEAPEEYDTDPLYMGALLLQRGASVRQSEVSLGEGVFRVDIVPEDERRNVNRLTEEEWERLLELAQVPEDLWDELIDAFLDYTDDNDLVRANGAEKDDRFYVEAGYEPKNGLLDSVDELLMIKGFDERIVFGGPSPEEDDLPYLGIARWLTTWGDGKINANVASRDVLLTLPELTEWEAEDILEKRLGLDETAGTRDDGFTSVDDMMVRAGVNPLLTDRFNTRTLNYIKVVSTGDADGVQYAISCTFQVQGTQMVILAWREEPVY